MGRLQPSMRLKVKADTFFLPQQDGTVYFRNNTSAFRMEGGAVQSWIEKLLPVFDGQHTLDSLTDGLPDAYRDRIYEVAEILYQNDFVRDVSTDLPHQLTDDVCTYFGPQIELVDNLVGSGAHHFQNYRNSNVLIVGTGELVLPTVRALFESGIEYIQLFAELDKDTTEQVQNVINAYQALGLGVTLKNGGTPDTNQANLLNMIRESDAVVYVSDDTDLDALRQVEEICAEAGIWFAPAICVGNKGVIGPILRSSRSVQSQQVRTFDTAWRRIHATVLESDKGISGFTPIAGAVLSNVLVFELFKYMTGVELSSEPGVYLLDGETLLGEWHSFIPSPTAEKMAPARIENLHDALQATTTVQQRELSDMLVGFKEMTDETFGVFHKWDEGDLPQLPLSQCRVQPAQPGCTGPTAPMEERVAIGFTHDDARYQAGLTGIETYVRALAQVAMQSQTPAFVGIGAGKTMAEAAGRATHECLTLELRREVASSTVMIRPVTIGLFEDEQAVFYLEALRATGVDPTFGQSQDIFGFPVIWVGVSDHFVGCIGFTHSQAVQYALAYALLEVSRSKDDVRFVDIPGVVVLQQSVKMLDALPTALDFPRWAGYSLADVELAVGRLEAVGCKITVWNLAMEPFLVDTFGGVLGISIGQEGLV